MWKILRLVKKGDYIYAVVPEHPNSTKNGYVLRVFGKESPNTWAFMQGMNLPFFEKEMSNSLLAIK